MRVIAFLVIIYIFFLSGCVKESDNIYKGIEEKDITETYVVRQTEEETTDSDYSIDKNLVRYFIDDSHFYDNEDGVDFAGFDETEEKYHVKILNAYISDNLEEFGEYYSNDHVKDSIADSVRWCIESRGYDEEDLTYMCVQVEITNKSAGNAVLYMNHSFRYVSRINDMRGQEFGLTDMRVELVSPSTELLYDSTKKENEGKQYYYLSLSAGETETTNCVYIFSKKLLGNDLYLELHFDKGEYNTKYNCTFPPTAKTTKYLKINLKENNIN